MHQESPALSKQVATDVSHRADQSSQYGLHHHEPPAALPSALGFAAGTASDLPRQLPLDTALAAPLQEESDASRLGTDQGLSKRKTASPPARNRIDEYEKASIPAVRKRDLPTFEVIKKQRNPNDKRSPVQDLPNGSWNSVPFCRVDELTKDRTSDPCTRTSLTY